MNCRICSYCHTERSTSAGGSTIFRTSEGSFRISSCMCSYTAKGPFRVEISSRGQFQRSARLVPGRFLLNFILNCYERIVYDLSKLSLRLVLFFFGSWWFLFFLFCWFCWGFNCWLFYSLLFLGCWCFSRLSWCCRWWSWCFSRWWSWCFSSFNWCYWCGWWSWWSSSVCFRLFLSWNNCFSCALSNWS